MSTAFLKVRARIGVSRMLLRELVAGSSARTLQSQVQADAIKSLLTACINDFEQEEKATIGTLIQGAGFADVDLSSLLGCLTKSRPKRRDGQDFTSIMQYLSSEDYDKCGINLDVAMEHIAIVLIYRYNVVCASEPTLLRCASIALACAYNDKVDALSHDYKINEFVKLKEKIYRKLVRRAIKEPKC